MESIGDRISIKRKENELSIVIYPSLNKTKNLLMFIWFLLWTASGIVVMFYYPQITDKNTKVGFIVWLGFWVYFEYMIIRVLLWKKYGFEKIKLRENKLMYKREILKRGKIKIFPFDFVKDIRMIEKNPNSIFEVLNNSYWSITGESLVFNYYGKEIRFGFNLSEYEASGLLKKIKNEMH